MAWYEKKMLSKDSISNVDESADESDSLDEYSKAANELDENEVKHDPFEFLHVEEIPFSRLLFNLMVLQVQGFDNGNANPNMPLLHNDVQVFYAPPRLYILQWPQVKTCPCNQWVPWNWTP